MTLRKYGNSVNPGVWCWPLNSHANLFYSAQLKTWWINVYVWRGDKCIGIADSNIHRSKAKEILDSFNARSGQ